MLSNYLILCCSLLFLPSIFPSISLFPWVGSSLQVAKVLESFNIRYSTMCFMKPSRRFWCAEVLEPLWRSEVAQSCPTLCNPMDLAHQAPPSMEYSRQEYWSGLPFPSPGDLPDPGIEPGSPGSAGRRLIIWATRRTTVAEAINQI